MEAVIFTGVQGAGKTTFYRERFLHTHVRVSLDMMRTRPRQQMIIAACLAAQQKYVVDNTNVLASERAEYIRQAKSAGFRVIGYFFRSELRAAIARNAKRNDKKAIPVPGLIAAYKRLQSPALEEGYDELYVVTLSAEGLYTVEALPTVGSETA